MYYTRRTRVFIDNPSQTFRSIQHPELHRIHPVKEHPMATASEHPVAIASDHFDHLVGWQVVVCKECRHAVWPEEVRGHLHGKQHGIPKQEASAVADEVQQ